MDIPAPDGLAYLPFQKAGIVYASNREVTIVGDEMGLGKTIQALGIVNAEVKKQPPDLTAGEFNRGE